MAKGLNWSRVAAEQRMHANGYQPHEDLLPRDASNPESVTRIAQPNAKRKKACRAMSRKASADLARTQIEILKSIIQTSESLDKDELHELRARLIDSELRLNKISGGARTLKNEVGKLHKCQRKKKKKIKRFELFKKIGESIFKIK